MIVRCKVCKFVFIGEDADINDAGSKLADHIQHEHKEEFIQFIESMIEVPVE